MTYTIAFLSQKGGVGKSTLARSLAAEITKTGKSAFLADLDTQQATAAEWSELRGDLEQAPAVTASEVKSVKEAQNMGANYDVLIIDGRPNASSETVQAALTADLTVIPSSNSYDDLKPAVALAHALADAGVNESKITFALNLISTQSEAKAAREWLESTGYSVLPEYLLYRPSWRKCGEEGTSLTETKFKSVNESARSFFIALIKELKG